MNHCSQNNLTISIRLLFLLIGMVLGVTELGLSQPMQQVLGAAGRVQSNATLQVESTIGEVFTQSFYAPTNWLTQGFLQPKKTILINTGTGTISSGTTATQLNGEDGFSVVAFPNPFESIVVIEQSEERNTELLIYDCTGRLVAQRSFTGLQTRIELSELVIGSYKLVFYTNAGESGSLPILKF